MESVERRYLFGQPVRPAKPAADGQRPLFVLGAYPSALHAKWIGPDGRLLIRAVAVDVEPEPFWTGDDEADRIDRWKDAMSFPVHWGSVKPCGRLNGSSGVWVRDKVLCPLGVERDSAWITDCLDTYYESAAAADRLDTDPIVSLVRRLGIPTRLHEPHPSEAAIVSLALAHHRERLLSELTTARPDVVVTLGNAALRVFIALAADVAEPLKRLSLRSYGMVRNATVAGQHVKWLPLAHPASPRVYHGVHEEWRKAPPRSII